MPWPSRSVGLAAVLAALLVGAPILAALPMPGDSCEADSCLASPNAPAWVRRYETPGAGPEVGGDRGQVGVEIGVGPNGTVVVGGHHRNARGATMSFYRARAGYGFRTWVTSADEEVVEIDPDDGPVLYRLAERADAGRAAVDRIDSFRPQFPQNPKADVDPYYSLVAVDDTSDYPDHQDQVIEADALRARDLAVASNRDRIAIAGDLDPGMAEDAFLVSHDASWNATWISGRDNLVADTLRSAAFADGRLHVAGGADGNLAVAAYRAADGSRIWAASLAGPAESRACCLAVVDGTAIAVGTHDPSSPGLVVAAFDAATGERAWVHRMPPSPARDVVPVAVEPTGDGVLVLAELAGGEASGYRLSAVGGDGQVEWTADHEDPVGAVHPVGLDVGPDGESVYVTGRRVRGLAWTSDVDALTVAHDARAEGEVAWTAAMGPQAAGRTVPRDVVVGPRGDRVVLTGSTVDARQGPGTAGVTDNSARLTWAYEASPTP